jgi:serine/threonine-protein phosphatase 2B catalytic subunit
VPPPAWHEPDDSAFYSQTDRNKPDVEFLKKHFIHEGRLKKEQALFILERGIEVLSAEDTLLEIEAPVNGNLL